MRVGFVCGVWLCVLCAVCDLMCDLVWCTRVVYAVVVCVLVNGLKVCVRVWVACG